MMAELSMRSLCLLALTLAGIRVSETGRIRSPKPNHKVDAGLPSLKDNAESSLSFASQEMQRTVGVGELGSKKHSKRAAGRRRLQVTEMENSTLLSVPAYSFPASYGDTIIVAPVAYVRRDGRNRNVVSYDTSSIRSTESSLRLRSAKIYVNFEHRSVATRRQQPRSSRTRHGYYQRRDVEIIPILVRESTASSVPLIVARGKFWLEYIPGGDLNRSGRLRSASTIKRYRFDVTKTGMARRNAATEENATENRHALDLPTLASWRLPNLQMAVICRRKRTRAIVKCQRNGVVVHGAPYLELTTTHVDGSNYGIRWK
uniref:Uncharacterized protein LOC108950505 n=1 Tax=Phallusia mammillata TaxID=59560 RepID=A0A6F9DIM5_9ASCI|nr:uncharacterized protein LOC108950505 [Phallusia mammillata]